jgi:hypothetical protein
MRTGRLLLDLNFTVVRLETITEDALAHTSSFPVKVISCTHGRFQPPRFLRVPRAIDPFPHPGDTHCPATHSPISGHTLHIKAKQQWLTMWSHILHMRSTSRRNCKAFLTFGPQLKENYLKYSLSVIIFNTKWINLSTLYIISSAGWWSCAVKGFRTLCYYNIYKCALLYPLPW